METVLMLLVICSAATTLVTQAIKAMMPEEGKFPKNLLAGIVSIAVSIAVSAGYLILTKTPMSPDVGVYIVCLVVLSWLCAMLGYDKVMQTITQLKTDKTTK